MNSRKIFVLFIIITFLASNTCYAVYEFGECDKVQKDSLRDELNRICQRVFSSETKNIDIKHIINSQWATIGMDDRYDKEIDNAVERVKKESGFIEKILSSWSPDKAKQFSEKITNYAFTSENFVSTVNALSSQLGGEIGKRLETISNHSASASLMCLMEFIGNRYSESVSHLFKEELKKQFAGIKWDEKVDLDQLSVAGMHKMALGGLGAIIAAQVVKKISQKIQERIAKRIGERIATRIIGRIAGSSVPILGWIIGSGMIAWDLIQSSDAAFRQIQNELKREEVKEKIKNEILIEVTDQLTKESYDMARKIADETYSMWSDFRNKFKHVLDLADDLPEFKLILDRTSKDGLYKLSNLTNLIYKKLGKEELIASIKNGSFMDVMSLPEISFQILETTKSLKTLLEWSELAGRQIDKVVEFEIYKQKTPADFDKRLLERLIDVNDKAAISKLTLLENTLMEAMLSVHTVNLKSICAKYGLDDMKCISWYLSQGDVNSKTVIIHHLVGSPSVINIKRLCDDSLKNQIMTFADKSEVFDFLFSPNTFLALLFNDGIKVITGRIPLNIFFYKYNVLKVIILATILIIVSFLVALFVLKFIRRQPEVTRE